MPASPQRRGEGGARHDDGWPRGLSAPARRALANAGYTELGQLAEVSESSLHQFHGMGPKAISVLRDALTARGLSFRT